MLARSESDLAFYSRRAMEEARAAAHARSVVVGAAHRHMAAVYALRVREVQEAAGDFREGFVDLERPVDERPIVEDLNYLDEQVGRQS